MQRIKSFGVTQTAKFFGVMYVLLTAVIAIPVAVIGAAMSLALKKPEGLTFLLLLLAPIVYGVVGFVGSAFTCWLYNILAERIGGIEIELQ